MSAHCKPLLGAALILLHAVVAPPPPHILRSHLLPPLSRCPKGPAPIDNETDVFHGERVRKSTGKLVLSGGCSSRRRPSDRGRRKWAVVTSVADASHAMRVAAVLSVGTRSSRRT